MSSVLVSSFTSCKPLVILRLTGCAPFYGEDYDEVVDKNLKADLNFNFEELGLKFSPDTMDLLKNLLKKVPKSRLSASEALEHVAFKIIESKKSAAEDIESTDHSGITQNLKDFHEK
jgi:serine/threonine protein kinase